MTRTMRLFDAFLAVDWSAQSRPSPVKKTADSVWVGELVVDQTSECAVPVETYWRTRHDCVRHVRERLLVHKAASRRVFLGFDFAYGYPAGFASALELAGDEPPWRQIWRELTRHIEDHPDNCNNRFEVASAVNTRCGPSTFGPLWGCLVGDRQPNLWSKRPIFPFEINSQLQLDYLRLTDSRLSGVKSVWQLFFAGSVGSQTLLGIPAVSGLRDDPELRLVSRVWPFETGFDPRPTPPSGPFVLHAEIWPGVVKGKVEQSLIREPSLIKDQAQVRAMVQWLAELDATNELSPLFDTPCDLGPDQIALSTEQEGWIFGTDWTARPKSV